MLGRDPLAHDMRFGVIAEAGKLDVNATPRDVLAALPGLDPSIAAAIVDWRDVDDVPDDGGGAERSDSTYHGAVTPYAPRNAPIETIEELRMLRGVDDGLWFGEDANRNGILDEGEDANADGRLAPGLADLLTLDSREPAVAPDGTARTSIRQVNALRTRMVGLFGTERADEIFAEVQLAQPFANRLDLVAALDLDESEVALLWPSITDGNRVGLIDAWSCREEVLIAVAGSEAARTIIAARPTLMPTTPTWLALAIGREGAAAYGALLSSGSYQFRVDLLAIRNDGAGWARIEASIDCSSGLPRVATIRALESSGWPLPWATPDQLRSLTGEVDVPAFLATGNR
jgi:hypothetical protein